MTDSTTAAVVVQRLAVLLDAGIPPHAVWRHADVEHPVVAAVAELAADGDLASVIVEWASGRAPAERAAWSAVAAAWAVATEVGAPLAATLARLAGVLRDAEQTAREVQLELTGPRATARVVLALPPLGLLVGLVLGVDTIGVLATTPVGWLCLTAGGLLLLAGRRWNRRLVAAASVTDPSAGLGLELLAIAVSGGSSPERAIDRVEAVLERCGLFGSVEPGRRTVAFSRAAGVPVAALLRAEAEEQRRGAHAEGRARAVLLGTRLLVPLGLCILPAFVALGVVPVLVALVSSTLNGW